MKKLLIASSVMAALSMGAAHADPLTLNGGTIEFIGEITDTTCYAAVDGTAAGAAGTPGDTSNTVILPVVAKNLLDGAKGKTAGLTPFKIAVRADITTGTETCTLGDIADRDINNLPTGTSHTVNKVRAIFGGTLSSADTNSYVNPAVPYAADTYNNVDMVTGYLKNIAEVAGGAGTRAFDSTLSGNPNGSSKNVQLQLLNDDLTVIKVGDSTSQMSGNTSAAVAAGTKTVLPYYVRYISTDTTVEAGMLRSFVTYDLYYE
ncbi:Fimbrial protein [Phytobacter ursingii]|nr:Fimbrial protein [Phytobacter ursingii]